MDCHTVVSRLSAYQDNELPVTDREAIESHLSGCPSCNEQFLKLQQAWEALGSLPDLNVSPGFYGQIQRLLDDTGTPRSKCRHMAGGSKGCCRHLRWHPLSRLESCLEW